MAFTASEQETEDLFRHADELLFRDRNYEEAEKLYRQVLSMDNQNIDAINSVAYCIKFAATVAEVKPDANTLFEQVYPLYQDSLRIDPDDIEANFNLGLLYLQNKNDLP